MNDFYIKLILVFVAGLVALYQALFNIVLNAKLKKIESLRELLAEYVSQISNLMTLREYAFEDRNVNDVKGSKEFNELNKEEKNELEERYIKPIDIAATELNKLNSKILLYLNDDNSELELKNILYQNIDLISDIHNLNKDKIRVNLNNLVKKSSEIFNRDLNKTNRFLFIKI